MAASRERVVSLHGLADETSLIVNCSGLGARELTGDNSVTPARGQQVVTNNPGIEEFFIETPFAEEWTAYWPYPDHVILGGSSRPGDTPIEPDLDRAERIVSRCAEVEPRLRRTDPWPPGRASPDSPDPPTGRRTHRHRPLRAQLRARRLRGHPLLGRGA